MARTVRYAKLDTPTARARLARGRQPHWLALAAGTHLGYQRWEHDKVGRWLIRRRKGRNAYSTRTLGPADDGGGVEGLSYEQACTAALATPQTSAPAAAHFTVRQAMVEYIEFLEMRGQPTNGVERTAVAHILPPLGHVPVAQLSTAQLRKWLADVAAAPARRRSPRGRQNFSPVPRDEEVTRARRVTANRIAATLRAALNHAYAEGRVPTADAWGKRWARFKGVDMARQRYLTIAEAERLLNACEAEFRAMVRAALETGCRFSELARCTVADFNADVGTVAIRKSKSAKMRHVVLSADGIEFFRHLTIGRDGAAPLVVRNALGGPWRVGMQGRLMRNACRHARIVPPANFHSLRHTWASHMIMRGCPAMVVAKNLGHRDTVMVEKFYGHLSPSFVAESIRAAAPNFGPLPASNVKPLRSQ